MTTPAAPWTLPGDYWNDAGGHVWAELQGLMDRLNGPVGEILAARADPPAGARVLDVGCGAGATALDMARRVGPYGACVGIDVAAPLLDLARRRAEEAGLANASFVQADAQTHAFGPARFDAIVSRFGVMFFADPDAAFANLRDAVRPGGTLTFVCWRGPEENPMSLEPLAAAAPFLPDLPRTPGDGPGRFAFADSGRVRGVLDRSGWRDVRIAPVDVATPLSFEELLTLSLRMGVLGPVLRGLDESLRLRVGQAVSERLRRHVRDGVVAMTAACWLVEARNATTP